MSAEVDQILREIAGDRSRGAAALPRRGLDALGALRADLPGDAAGAKRALGGLAQRIDGLRPSMAAIGAQALLAARRTAALIDGGLPPPGALVRAVNEEREALGSANGAIARLAAAALGAGGAIATCSWSDAAFAALCAVRPSRVILGDGDTLGDGRRAAERLGEAGLDVELLPDGEMPAAVGRSRAVLVGADQMLLDGALVNRSGTHALALAAREAGVPFFCACQRIKLAGNAHVDLEPLFDVTPAALIDSYLTEKGRLSPAGAGALGAEIAALRAELAGGRRRP